MERAFSGAALAALILFTGCARPMLPPGGPPDLTPPGVVWTLPSADSVEVGVDTEIRIRFSERMDRRSVERAVFVSPQFSREPELKWHGRELEVRPPEALRPDRTYLVTVGAESADESSNRMAASYSFAFSTGSRLDRGEIAGRVLGPQKPSGQTYVWAYDLPEGGAAPDPGSAPPAYVTQPGTDGGYRFPRLGEGRYRIFAFEDRDRDGAYTPGEEPLAVPPADVRLRSGAERVRLGPLKMAVRDTAPPRFVSGRTPDRRHVLLRFNEPVQPPAGMAARGTDGPLEVLAVYADAGDSIRVWLLTGPQAGGAAYRIDLAGVADRAGNRIPEGEAAEVRGDGEADRRAPEAVSFFPARDARYVAPEAALEVDFSEAMAPEAGVDFWAASDTTVAPGGTFSWPAPNRLRFVPDAPWPAGGTVRLLGRGARLADVAGNRLKADIRFRFTVLAPDDLGELSGELVPAESPVVVEATDLSPPARVYRATVAAGDSVYLLTGVVPGRYRVAGFLDRDGDGAWTPGRIEPFAPAEPIAELPDTLEVRARWETAAESRLQVQTHALLSAPLPEE